MGTPNADDRNSEGKGGIGPRRRRTPVERRRARARGLDRYGRPLPRVLVKRFLVEDLRCFICRREYVTKAGNLRLLVIGGRPYAYRCFDRGACLERERYLRSINQLPKAS